MNKNQLKKELIKLNVYPGFYSLDGEVLPDRIILTNKGNHWEVFILDERGNKREVKIFSREEEACGSIYEYFTNSKFDFKIKDT